MVSSVWKGAECRVSRTRTFRARSSKDEQANGPWTESHIIHQPAAEPFLAASDHEDPPAQAHHETGMVPGCPTWSILPHIGPEMAIAGMIREYWQR